MDCEIFVYRSSILLNFSEPNLDQKQFKSLTNKSDFQKPCYLLSDKKEYDFFPGCIRCKYNMSNTFSLTKQIIFEQKKEFLFAVDFL